MPARKTKRRRGAGVEPRGARTAATLPRREFLRAAVGAGVTLSVPAIADAATLGREMRAPPSERITLGFIGIGMMGQGHLRVFLERSETQVLAVCDVDRWRRENAKASVERAYATSRSDGEYSGCSAYNDLRELVARSDVDAVVIATGDRWHVPAGMLAARAGKDIYCEKPMSATIREARAMAEIVRRYGLVFQTGLQQRSTPEFRTACALVQKGHVGRVERVFVSFPGTSENVNLPEEPVPEGLDWDLWLGPAPWRPYNARFHHYGRPPFVVPWHFCSDFGGGNLTSNAVHAFDVVQWGLGMDESGPVEIVPPETGDVPSLTYKYASGTLLQVDFKLDPKRHVVPKGWDVNTPIQPFGALFVGDEGWIHVGRQGYLRSWPESILESGRTEDTHPIPDHHRNWLSSIRSRERPACDVAIGCRSTIVSHLGCIAHWTGRALQWDPEAEEFLGDDEANRLRSRAMRAPWRL